MAFETTVTVRYAETDRMGIAHHSIYPVWLEEARTQWMASTGIPYSKMEEAGVMLPLTSLTCHYLGSCTYEDVLTIITYIRSMSAARISFGYEILKDGQKITKAVTDHAWVDAKTFRPISLKKRFPSIYRMLETVKDAE